MKKIISIVSVFFAAFIIQSFISPSGINKYNSSSEKKEIIKKKEYVKYVFCIAREQAKSGGKNQPVVTNVFKFTCGDEQYPKDYIILGEFNTYYDAFYKKNRNTMHIKDENKFMYNSYSEAEKGRRERIAKYVNNGDDPLLIEKFSVLCPD